MSTSPKLIDLIGQKFEKLLVTEATKDKRGWTVWRCLCDCGCERIAEGGKLRKGIVKACKSCSRPFRRPRNYTAGEITLNTWNNIIRKAKERHIPFEITESYAYQIFLDQNKRCALTGLPIQFSVNGKSGKNTASLDRIDNSKGYCVGNVQWLYNDINMMKREHSQDRFIELCRMVAEHQK